MKTKLFTIAALAATTLFVSCNKEDKSNILDNGKPTYMAISFTVPANSIPTKATTDPNATEAEAAFKYVDVFIYNASTGVQVKHARIAADQFTGPAAGSNSDEWTMKTAAKIATTVGQKTIFVGINLSSAFSASLTGVSMSEFTTISRSVNVADVASSIDGFAMFSTVPKAATLVADASQNNIKVQVQRLVAKVTVQKDQNMVINGPGYLDNLSFVLNNTNKRTFLVQPADKKDHNWATTPAGDLADGNMDYVSIDPYNKTVKELTPKYCLENTTRDYLMGQITRATVRATFVPNQIKDFANGSNNAAGYVDQDIPSSTSPQTFYAVTYNAGANKAYFFNSAVATAFAADNGGTLPVAYASGFCYWDMFLNPDSVSGPYDVLRNDFYRCTITKILAPGRPTPEVIDPSIPPAQPTDLMVDIQMLYWNPISKNYELEP